MNGLLDTPSMVKNLAASPNLSSIWRSLFLFSSLYDC